MVVGELTEAIRTGSNGNFNLPDFDHAVRRHRMLDAIVQLHRRGNGRKLSYYSAQFARPAQLMPDLDSPRIRKILPPRRKVAKFGGER